MRIETPRIVQARSRAIYFWLLLPVLLAVVGYAGWRFSLDYRLEVESSRVDLQQQYAHQQKLYAHQQKLNAMLETERDQLRERVAVLERAAQVDQEATRHVKEELKKGKERWQEMEGELKFLRHIASGGEKPGALFIQGFGLRKGPEKQSFIYKFTVSSGLKKSKHSKGWISLHLLGELGGVEKKLALQEIALSKQERIQMRFRHFQDIEGTVQLPEAFIPKSVLIEVEPTNKKLAPIKKQFNWLIAG